MVTRKLDASKEMKMPWPPSKQTMMSQTLSGHARRHTKMVNERRQPRFAKIAGMMQA
jgi:hypothetical protein